MNLHQLNEIYLAAIELYNKDKEVTHIQIDLQIKDIIFEKKFSILKVDARKNKLTKQEIEEIKQKTKINLNSITKPQINEKNGKYIF